MTGPFCFLSDLAILVNPPLGLIAVALAGTRTVVSPPAVLSLTMKITEPLLALSMPSTFPSRSTVRGCGLGWERELDEEPDEESGLSWCVG